jgi:hypothetical protein
MGMFSKILEKLGLKKDESTSTAGTVSGAPKPSASVAAPARPVAPVNAPKPAAPVKPVAKPRPEAEKDETIERISDAAPVASPTPMSTVDVAAMLDKLAAGHSINPNWKNSISDLLFILGIDNSLEARKELATELNCPAELMGNSAKMNVWLHKTVLKMIAQNGGKLPKELLDD